VGHFCANVDFSAREQARDVLSHAGVARLSTEPTQLTEPVRERGKERRALRVMPPLGASVLRWVVLALGVGAFLTFWPLWVPLVLAAWFALIVRPLHARLSRVMGKKERGAGVATVLLVLVGLAPVVAVLLSLATDAVDPCRGFQIHRCARGARHLLNGAMLAGRRIPRIST
jgi:hypothetical protein